MPHEPGRKMEFLVQEKEPLTSLGDEVGPQVGVRKTRVWTDVEAAQILTLTRS